MENRPRLFPISTQLLPSSNETAVDSSIAAEISFEYESQLRVLTGCSSGTIVIDCLLLGMGPDGHTCSLFPGHSLLQTRDKSVSWLIDSPKPPASRITLTLSAIESARSVFIVATGDSKRPVIKQVFEQNSALPVAIVNRMILKNSFDSANRRARFFLDKDASCF